MNMKLKNYGILHWDYKVRWFFHSAKYDIGFKKGGTDEWAIERWPEASSIWSRNNGAHQRIKWFLIVIRGKANVAVLTPTLSIKLLKIV